jgi:hypothetical protein
MEGFPFRECDFERWYEAAGCAGATAGAETHKRFEIKERGERRQDFLELSD